jgi:KDO2-lipid IV(A) lauroyltransferase
MTLKNLSLVYEKPPDHRQLVTMAHRVFVNAGKNVADAVLLSSFKPAHIDKVIKIQGRHHLDDALSQRRGVIVITGHIGNWEMLAARFAMVGYPVTAVARRIYDPRLDRILSDLRKNTQVRGISRDTDIREMIRVLRRGEILGVLMDQDTKVRGVFVPFFGRPAHTPVGPAVLALKTGAPIVPMVILRQPEDTYLITVRPALKVNYTGDRDKDVVFLTAACTRTVEQFIRQDPTQWVWMHNRWKKRPAGEDLSTWREHFREPL